MDRGRPTSYRDEFVEQAAKLCRLGATDIELADFFEVHVSTIYRWMQQHDDFCDAIKSAKGPADDRVERSLYHRAIGYSYDAVKIFNNNGEPLVVPYREHVPPDPASAFIWLKNRRPDQWRDKRQVDANVSITDTTEQHLRALLEMAQAKTIDGDVVEVQQIARVDGEVVEMVQEEPARAPLGIYSHEAEDDLERVDEPSGTKDGYDRS